MASLSRAEALDVLENPKNQKEIQQAKRKRLRNELHTETKTDYGIYEAYDRAASDFLDWVKRVLNDETIQRRFQTLLVPPYATNELVETINTELHRAINSNEHVVKLNFSDPELEIEAEEYRKKLGDHVFWKTAGFDEFTHSVDNILVVDLPNLELDDLGNIIDPPDIPEPYYYFLDINNLIDIENKKVLIPDDTLSTFTTFKTEYVAFFESEEMAVLIDDDFYRTFSYIDGNFSLLSESEHNLGFCPAKSFWSTPLNSKTDIVKKGGITNSYSNLDWLLFWHTSKKYLDQYAAFPIYAAYKKKCTYFDPKREAACNAGYLQWTDEFGNEHTDNCPNCSKPANLGPGAFVEIEAPQDDDHDLMKNPVQVIPAEKVSIEFAVSEVERLWDLIYLNSVGVSSEAKNDQAKNEKQIQGMFESRENVHSKIRKNFEVAQSFVLDVVMKLRYGDSYISNSVSYGNKSYLQSESDQIEELKSAKEAGMANYELGIRKEKIIKSRYRNNPDMIARIEILKHLEPYPDYSLTELIELKNSDPGLVSRIDLIKKAKFNSFIDRFERENVSIINFGVNNNFDIKIKSISVILDQYANEDIMSGDIEGVGSTDIDGSQIETPIDIEAESKAKLKGSVGGVQGILEIQLSVANGVTQYDAALSLLDEIYGFDSATASRILGNRSSIRRNNTQNNL